MTVAPEHVTTGWDVAMAIVNQWPTICGSIAAIIAAIASLVGAAKGVQNAKVIKEGNIQKDAIMEKVVSIENHANGLTKALLDAKGISSHAEGVADERASAAAQRLNEIRGEAK